MQEVITPETLPDAVDVAAADGGSADLSDSISLSALKEVLGKDFKSADSALKSIKDTYSYVGDVGKVKNVITEAKTRLNTDDQGVLAALNKLMENNTDVQAKEAAPQPQAEGQYLTEAQLNARLEEVAFFSKNEDIADIKDVLAPIKAVHGKDMSWSEFVGTDMAKKVIEPARGYKEVQAKKSVLESNPRLGAATDKLSTAKSLMDEARTADRNGDVYTARTAQTQARSSAVQSVLEAYDL